VREGHTSCTAAGQMFRNVFEECRKQKGGSDKDFLKLDRRSKFVHFS